MLEESDLGGAEGEPDSDQDRCDQFWEKCYDRPPGYSCRICRKRIKALANMRRHIMDIHFHDGSKYRCPDCEGNKEYRTKNTFQKHVAQIHRDTWRHGKDLERFIVKKESSAGSGRS